MLKRWFWFLTKRTGSPVVYMMDGKMYANPRNVDELWELGVENVLPDPYAPLHHYEVKWLWE